MSRALGQRDSPLKRVAANQHGVRNEEQKPVLGGPKIFVGDYISAGNPSNDPPYTSVSSPPWLNGFTWMAGYPIWFAHGVDGETDMGGMYDLITGSPVTGTIAFMMPLEWAAETPPAVAFPVRVFEGATLDLDIWAMAVQVVNLADPDIVGSDIPVRIYWPLCGVDCP
jgi:hypothetical protein